MRLNAKSRSLGWGTPIIIITLTKIIRGWVRPRWESCPMVISNERRHRRAVSGCGSLHGYLDTIGEEDKIEFGLVLPADVDDAGDHASGYFVPP